MPVTSLDLRNRADMPDLSTVLGNINTTEFLFGDEGEKPSKRNRYSQPYLRMDTTEDKFPILVRREGESSIQSSAESTALDAAVTQSPESDSRTSDWPTSNKNRLSQQSLPLHTLRRLSHNDDFSQDLSRDGNHMQANGMNSEPAVKLGATNRRSMEVKFGNFSDRRSSLVGGSMNGSAAGVPKLQSSYSTSDIPTVKNPNGSTPVNTGVPKSHAEQRLHNHNASLGRIPPGAVSNRQSREIASNEVRLDEQVNNLRNLNSALQGSAPSFGPSVAATAGNANAENKNIPAVASSTASGMPAYTNPNYYNPYGMQVMNMDLANMQLGGASWNSQMAALYQGQYPSYSNPYQQYGVGRQQDAQQRALHQRHMQLNGHVYPSVHDAADSSANTSAETARWANTPIEDLKPEIYAMCKDQHGCRFLQRTLEERNPEHVQLIFDETNQHAVELMTGMIYTLFSI